MYKTWTIAPESVFYRGKCEERGGRDAIFHRLFWGAACLKKPPQNGIRDLEGVWDIFMLTLHGSAMTRFGQIMPMHSLYRQSLLCPSAQTHTKAFIMIHDHDPDASRSQAVADQAALFPQPRHGDGFRSPVHRGRRVHISLGNKYLPYPFMKYGEYKCKPFGTEYASAVKTSSFTLRGWYTPSRLPPLPNSSQALREFPYKHQHSGMSRLRRRSGFRPTGKQPEQTHCWCITIVTCSARTLTHKTYWNQYVQKYSTKNCSTSKFEGLYYPGGKKICPPKLTLKFNTQVYTITKLLIKKQNLSKLGQFHFGIIAIHDDQGVGWDIVHLPPGS